MNNKNNIHSPKRTAIRLYLATILILLASLTNACNLMTIYGSGNIVTKTVDLHDFNRVVFSGAGELTLSQADAETIAVAADDNLIEHIKVEVSEGTLYISHRETISPSKPIRIRVSVKEMTGLDLAGIISAEASELQAEGLKIDISGLTKLKVKSLEAEKLVVNLSGSSEFELTGTGKVGEQVITLNGSNDYKAPKLQSETTTIALSGSNEVTVWAVDLMKVTISGNGSVQYYGSPQINQSGSGNVKLFGLGSQK